MKFSKKDAFTIPNILTYIRLLLVPVFVWLMLDKNIAYNVFIAAGVFLFAELTDLVDGYIARKFNQVSDIGKVIDPIADKLLQVSALVCLTIIGNVHWAFTLFMIVKEGYMIIGASVVLKLVGSKIDVQANFWGKAAGALFTAGCTLAFFHKFMIKALYIDWIIIGIGCLFALVAAIQYTNIIIKQVKASKAKELNNCDCKEQSEIDIQTQDCINEDIQKEDTQNEDKQ